MVKFFCCWFDYFGYVFNGERIFMKFEECFVGFVIVMYVLFGLLF